MSSAGAAPDTLAGPRGTGRVGERGSRPGDAVRDGIGLFPGGATSRLERGRVGRDGAGERGGSRDRSSFS